MLSILAVGFIVGLLVILYVRQHYLPANNRARFQRELEHQPSSDLRKRILEKHEQMGDLSDGLRKEFNPRISVADIMTSKIAAVPANSSVAEVSDRMTRLGTRHLVVQNEAGRLVGVISQRDVLAGGKTAADIMTDHPVTVSPSSSIGNAVALILNNRISSLPVIEDDRLCGILTTSDLLMALECLVQFYEEHATSTAKLTFKGARYQTTEPIAQTAG